MLTSLPLSPAVIKLRATFPSNCLKLQIIIRGWRSVSNILFFPILLHLMFQMRRQEVSTRTLEWTRRRIWARRGGFQRRGEMSLGLSWMGECREEAKNLLPCPRPLLLSTGLPYALHTTPVPCLLSLIPWYVNVHLQLY